MNVLYFFYPVALLVCSQFLDVAWAQSYEYSQSWNSSASCCQRLSSQLGSKVSYPGSSVYISETNGSAAYWSQQEASILSTCRVTPTSAEDVSVAVVALDQGNCSFAVRGGGHTPFAGAANIEDGVTIDLGSMDQVSVNQDQTITSIGAGARWGNVYLMLDAMNLAVSGGRVSDVGVAGLTLGGGLSFFAPQHGFACDGVVNHEVVLASGQIVIANEFENADLHQALKGGSNNFGVVTRFDLKTFPQGKFWGGIIVLPITSAQEQFQPLVDFNTASGAGVDPFATVINAYVYSNTTGNVITNFPVYTKPEPFPAILQNFTNMQPQLLNGLEITNLTTFTDELNGSELGGFRQLWATLTVGNDAELLSSIFNASDSLVNPLLGIVPNLQWALAFQAVPMSASAQGALNGGNALGVSPTDGNLFIINLGVQWTEEADDARLNAVAEDFLSQATQLAEAKALLNAFVYLNYALPTQNPLGSYGSENLQLLRDVSAKYDPGRVFQRLVPGGFKIPG